MNGNKINRGAVKPNLIWAVVLAVTGGPSFTGCTATMRISDSNVETLQFQDLVDMLGKRNDRTILIDVRMPRAFTDGHIPVAINIPITELRPGDPRLAGAKNIVVSSGNLQDMLSLAAAKTLLRMGYKNIYDFRGGLKAWQAHHKRIASETQSGGH